MKKYVVCLASVFISAQLFAVDSIRFTEKLTDKLVRSGDPDTGFVYEPVTTISGTFNASITFPGFKDVTREELINSKFSFTVGGVDFSATGDERDPKSPSNSAIFYQTIGDRRVGTITFSRNGDVLTISAQSSDLDGDSFAAEGHAGDTNPPSGQIQAHIQIGELFQTTRNVYYKGTSSVTHKTVGSGDDAQEFNLNSVTLSGETDTALPTVSITMPKANQRWSNEVFIVRGKAADNFGIQSVSLWVNEVDLGAAQFANGNWEKEISLAPGTNIIKAQSIDLEGNHSITGQVKMIYVLTDNLDLLVDAGGKVTGVSNQQLLELGKRYKATATASNTFLFAGWEGDITSTNPVLSFLMATNLSLHAKFIPNPFLPLMGVYNGLFFPGNSSAVRSEITTDSVTSSNAGFFTGKLSDRGICDGKVLIGGATLPFSRVQFSLTGSAHFTIVRPRPIPDLIIDLQLDFQNGTKTLVGAIQSSDNSFTAQLLADLAVGNATFLAKHTFVIPGGAVEDTNAPAGHGAGTIGVNNVGTLTLAGSLADGTPISQSTSLSSSGDWPLYVSLQGGRGLLLGWANFTTNPQPYHVSGSHIRWIKAPANTAADKFYRAGFNQEKMLRGARYIAPPLQTNILGWSNGVALIDGGNLPATISNPVTVANNKVSILSNSNTVVVTLTPATGLVAGSFKHANFGATPRTLKGVVIQLPAEKSFIGGWFLGTDQSGYLFLRRDPEIP